MGHLTEMRWFEIQDDYVVGTLPESLGNWRQLHTLLLGGNYLEGGIPDTFAQNELLGTIFIDRNNFNGTFPTVFATMKNLEWLDAEQNGFVGTLPSEMGRLKDLSEFFALLWCVHVDNRHVLLTTFSNVSILYGKESSTRTTTA